MVAHHAVGLLPFRCMSGASLRQHVAPFLQPFVCAIGLRIRWIRLTLLLLECCTLIELWAVILYLDARLRLLLLKRGLLALQHLLVLLLGMLLLRILLLCLVGVLSRREM